MRLVTGAVVAILLMTARTTLAQAAAPDASTLRIFVDANLLGGTSSLAGERTFTSQFLKFGELGSLRSTYPAPSHTNPFSFVELGGGVMFTTLVGVGASYGRTTHENVVDLEATVPHPTFLRALASGTRVTDEKLGRKEGATHVFGVLVPILTSRTEVRLFGGPSFFSYDADMVQDVLYAQAYDGLTPQNSITINGFTTREATGRGVGFHMGGDLTYFFTRVFGVAAGARFSHGTVTVDDEPLSGIRQQIRVGSTLGFVGVRVRFGV